MTVDELVSKLRIARSHTRRGAEVRFGNNPELMPGPEDTYQSYGTAWANLSNTPFRLYKHWVHEGGISSPLIAHWPRGIERKGAIEHQAGHLIDLMATCIDLSGAAYPKQHNGKEIKPMEGVTLRTAFEGKPLGRGKPIFFEHEANRAVRDGQWKLVARGIDGPWELYDIDADRSEMHNLADQHPDRVKTMADAWQKWAETNDVLPLDDRGHK